MALVQAKFFVTLCPETENVSGIVPLSTEAPPRVAFLAKVRTTEPGVVAVAGVLLVTVTPDGSVPTVHVAAFCSMPSYATNGMVTVVAAVTAPPEVQGIVCASLERITDRPPEPAEPGVPGSPCAPSYSLVMVIVS